MARTDTLVQTLLPADLASWVRARAAHEGLQVSGWVRQLIVRERMRLVVDAWWCPPGARRQIDRARAPFRLERVGYGADGAIEFRLLDPELGAVRDDQLASMHREMRDALYDGTFALRGDTRRWRVVQALADAEAGNEMRLLMRQERASTRGRRAT